MRRLYSQNIADKYIDIHTHRDSVGDDVLAIRNCFPGERPAPEKGAYFSSGLHPWHIREDTFADQLGQVAEALGDPRCLAVGECGLDRVTAAPWALQQQVFLAQIALASSANKPLLIHGVRAYPEIIAIKKASKAAGSWIIHGFRGNLTGAIQLIKNGFYLSLGEAAWGGARASGREILAVLPPEKLFLETDNSDCSIREIYELAAAALNRSVTELKKLIAANFAEVFNHVP